MSRKYDGWPIVVGMDTRAFKAARNDCNCRSEVNWIGAIVYVRSSGDFYKVIRGNNNCSLFFTINTTYFLF